jgi:hypothetical protein
VIASRFRVSVAACVLAAATVVAAHDENDLGPDFDVYKVTKSGSVKIASDVTIGTLLVKKGSYLFAHRIDDGVHVVTLTHLGGGEVFEIPLTVISEPRPAKRSELIVKQLPDRSMVVTLIAVEGEVGDHLPRIATMR